MKEQRQSWFSILYSWIREFGPASLRPFTIGVLTVGVIAVLIPKSLFHSFKCEVTNVATSFVSSDRFAIDHQVIIRGTHDEIRDLVAGPLGLTLIQGCDLSYLNSRDNPDPTLTEAQRKALVVQLYQMPGNLTVDDVLAQINQAKNNQPNLKIDADPNYLVSRSDADTDPCGRPNSDSGGGGGKDFGGPGVLDPSAYDATGAMNAFTGQWALGNQGIGLFSSTALAGSTYTGRGVRVAVFDSSPFRITLPFYRKVGIALPSPLWFKVRDTLASRNIKSSHGEFVAELIHEVAPGSKVELIHVLDDNGCTRLMPLITALEDYISRRSMWTGNLNKTVINMSLGIRVPNSVLALGKDLNTLEGTIADAYDRGAIIVAAAGNDSSRKDENGNVVVGPMPMQIPANSLKVIGVAALNENGQLSCYSNVGDVAAPGGDGGQDPHDATNPCVPRTETATTDHDPCSLNDMEHCRYGVISLIHTDTVPQYALWSGTSFSTPLVSGLAALAYERWGQKYVECVIEHGAIPGHITTPPGPLGWGIMNIDKTLTDPSVQAACSAYR